MILHFSKKILEEMELYVTVFRIFFHFVRRIWKLLLKKTKRLVQVKNSYYWLNYDGIKNNISMCRYDHLESEQTRIEKETFSY